MKNTFKRAHEMAKEIKKEYPEVDYRLQFGLCLSYLLNNKEELEMIQRYQEYLNKFGLAYTEPMSYKDFVEHCKKEDAREAEREKAIADALPAAEANYAHYIEQAAQADEDEAKGDRKKNERAPRQHMPGALGKGRKRSYRSRSAGIQQSKANHTGSLQKEKKTCKALYSDQRI